MTDSTSVLSEATNTGERAGGGGRPRPQRATPELSDRDTSIVGYTRMFKQLTTLHYKRLIFHKNASDTPMERRLTFLADHGFLYRSKQTVDEGGGKRWVYRLGPAGHQMFSDKPFKPVRNNVKHSLYIANCVTELYELHRSGKVFIEELEVEPRLPIGRSPDGQSCKILLSPDFTTTLRIDDYELPLWVEVENSNKSPTFLRNKIDRYCRALHNYAAADRLLVPVFKYILFVVPDQHRVREIERYVRERQDERERNLFRVVTFDKFKYSF